MSLETFVQIGIYVIILYWLGASLFAIRTAKTCLSRTRKLQLKTIPEVFKPFARKEITPEHERSIIIGCFIRFPIRFFIMSSYLVTLATLGALKMYFKFPMSLVQLYRKYIGRLSLKICVKTTQNFDPFESISTPVVISNHTSWIQTVYFGSFPQLISWIAKEQVAKMPIISTLTRYNRCLYVKRSSSDSRQQTHEQIKDRVNNFNKKIEPYPLVVYVQGTVSNGKSLLKFKNGAFEPLSPITIFSFQIQCDQFDPQIADVKLAQAYVISLCVRPSLIVNKAVINPKEGQTVTQYQERCRQKLASMGNFVTYEASFEELKQFMNFIAQSPDGQAKMQ